MAQIECSCPFTYSIHVNFHEISSQIRVTLDKVRKNSWKTDENSHDWLMLLEIKEGKGSLKLLWPMFIYVIILISFANLMTLVEFWMSGKGLISLSMCHLSEFSRNFHSFSWIRIEKDDTHRLLLMSRYVNFGKLNKDAGTWPSSKLFANYITLSAFFHEILCLFPINSSSNERKRHRKIDEMMESYGYAREWRCQVKIWDFSGKTIHTNVNSGQSELHRMTGWS